MSNNFGIFLLFSILVTGLVSNSAFAEETPVNATGTDATSTNSTSIEIEDGVVMSDNPTETNGTSLTNSASEDMIETEVTPTIPSPLKQIKEGTLPENVVCKEGLGLVFKLTGQPACVKTTSIEKLIAWGWTK